ncbi:MAG: sigma 54-interacting transcriptional regulator, partial [Pseudomonadota bacterium]
MAKAHIVILDGDRESAERLRELLTHTDRPPPTIAAPDAVKRSADPADARLGAVILGRSLSAGQRARLRTTFAARAPEAAIVTVSASRETKASDGELALPWPPSPADVERTLLAIDTAWAERRSDADGPRLTGASDAIEGVRTLVSQVSSSDATVIITGESGTGKEVAARQVHALSNRSDGPFVAVNCGAIPAELIE